MEDSKLTRKFELPSKKLSKKEQLDLDLQLLARALKDKVQKYTMPLRASTGTIIYENQALALPVGFEYNMLEDYANTVELLDTLKSKTWLRISPYLISRGGISNLEIQALIASSETRSRELSRKLIERNDNLSILTLDEIQSSKNGIPSAYKIQTGDKIATLTIQRKK